MTVEEIKTKIRQRTATIQEIAWAIPQDRYLLFNSLMDNNLNDVNVTLRTDLGNDKILPVRPDRKAMEAVIDAYIRSDDKQALQTILDEFDYNPEADNYTTKLSFIQTLKPGSVASKLNFSQAAGEFGTGIGNFLSPVLGSLGSDTTTQTVAKPSSTNTIAIVVVIVVVIAAAYLLFFYKPNKAGAAAPATA